MYWLEYNIALNILSWLFLIFIVTFFIMISNIAIWYVFSFWNEEKIKKNNRAVLQLMIWTIFIFILFYITPNILIKFDNIKFYWITFWKILKTSKNDFYNIINSINWNNKNILDNNNVEINNL